MKNIQKKKVPTPVKVEKETPTRVAPRMEGVVKNTGIKEVKKEKR